MGHNKYDDCWIQTAIQQLFCYIGTLTVLLLPNADAWIYGG